MRVVLLLAVCSLLRTGTAAAQEEPFSRLDLSAGLAEVRADRTLGAAWAPGHAVAIRGAVPFHIGSLNAVFRYGRFEGGPEVPDFDAVTLLAGWGRSLWPTPWLEIGAAVSLGNMRMAFDDNAARPGIRNESEFTAGWSVSLRVGLTGPWFVRAESAWERTYTRPEFDLHLVTVTVGRALDLPAWISEALR